MKTIYDVKELCAEILKISVRTFNVHKERYMEELEKEYHVTIETGARNKKFYILDPKENEVAILRDATPEVEQLKRNNLKNIEAILKAVMIDKVIPVADEIAEKTGISESTVKRCIKKMRDNGILLEPPTEEARFTNEHTGEVTDYTVKKCSYIYYDVLPSGKRELIEYFDIHNVFGELFRKKMDKLYHEHRGNFSREIALQVSGFHAWKEINLAFNLHNGNRVARWIVAPEYKKLINEKHR